MCQVRKSNIFRQPNWPKFTKEPEVNPSFILEYRKFKDLIKTCMKEIKHEISHKQIKVFVEQN